MSYPNPAATASISGSGRLSVPISPRIMTMSARTRRLSTSAGIFANTAVRCRRSILSMKPARSISRRISGISLYWRNWRNRDTTRPSMPFSRQSLQQLARLQILGDEGLDYGKTITSREFGKQAILSDLLYFKYYFLDTLQIPYDKERLIDDFERLSTYLTAGRPQIFSFPRFPKPQYPAEGRPGPFHRFPGWNERRAAIRRRFPAMAGQSGVVGFMEGLAAGILYGLCRRTAGEEDRPGLPSSGNTMAMC